jgi:hypothetical protein
MSAGDRERLGSIRRFSLAPVPNDSHRYYIYIYIYIYSI